MTVVVALLATLAACGGSSHAADPSSPVPITTTPVRSTGTTSASPTLDPNSDAAIIAAVHAWVSALNVASSQVSMTPLAQLATRNCACIASLTSATQYLAQHNLHLNVDYEVKDATVTARKGARATVQVSIENGPYQALNADNSVFKDEPPATTSNQFVFSLEGGQWLVDAIV